MSDNAPAIFGGDLPSGRRLASSDRPNHVGSIGDGLDVTLEGLAAARQTLAGRTPRRLRAHRPP